MGVEKLAVQKFAEITSRQDALQTIFSVRLDIFYPPNLPRFLKYRVFQQSSDIATTIVQGAVPEKLAGREACHDVSVLDQTRRIRVGIINF